MYDFTASKGARPFRIVAMGNLAAFSQAVTFYVVSPLRPSGDVGTHVFSFVPTPRGCGRYAGQKRNEAEMAVPDKLR